MGQGLQALLGATGAKEGVASQAQQAPQASQASQAVEPQKGFDLFGGSRPGEESGDIRRRVYSAPDFQNTTQEVYKKLIEKMKQEQGMGGGY